MLQNGTKPVVPYQALVSQASRASYSVRTRGERKADKRALKHLFQTCPPLACEWLLFAGNSNGPDSPQTSVSISGLGNLRRQWNELGEDLPGGYPYDNSAISQ
jgi:hypothetical protein